jgi:F-type H+-transporting ATPase subunit a
LAGSILAAGPGFEAPGIDVFYPEPIVRFELLGIDFAITRLQVISWIAVLAVIALFVAAVRRPQLVPGRMQWFGESAYSFIRDGVAREVIGREGLRFGPYLATLFMFIFANNVMGIVPLAQIAPTSKIAIPAFLAAVSWILFNWIGIRKHGFLGYFKGMLFPSGVPKPLYILITPIEFFSTIIVRPFTLAVRLFANMFAGHMLLLVFALGTTYLLTVGNFSVIFSPVSFLVAILMTLFEFVVEALQAYVFTILTAVYLAGAMEEEH